MPEYLAPGVFVEETSFRSKSIEGVSTTTTGFIGPCRYGPITATPDVITSLGEFERIYAGGGKLEYRNDQGQPVEYRDQRGQLRTDTDNYLWHAVRAFFIEGGKRLYITRVFRPLLAAGSEDFYPLRDAEGRVNRVAGDPTATPVYVDGHSRAIRGNVSIRSRFPGAASEMVVILSAHAGQNILAAERVPGPIQSPLSQLEPEFRPRLRGLVHRDVVFIQRAPNIPLAGGPAEGFFLAEHDTMNNVWEFSSLTTPGQVWNLDQLQLRVSSAPNAGDSIYVITLTVNVLSGDRDHDLGTWTTLPLDPHHERFGVPDSAFDYFSVSPSTAALGRTLPIVIPKPATSNTGLHVLRDLFGIPPQTFPVPVEPVPGNLTLIQRMQRNQITCTLNLEGGNDGQHPGAAEYEGHDVVVQENPAGAPFKTGLIQFEDIDDISIVAAPGAMANYDLFRDDANTIMGLLIAHTQKMVYRIAVLDSPPGAGIADVRKVRAKLDSKYAAFYYPWVTIMDPITRKNLNLPPSGFVAGIYARNDITRAVWKAPANEVVTLAVDFEQILNKGQQEVLNPEGINCFRFFEGRGYRLWGARTVSSDPEWKYVNLRRYFAYLEHSIDKGTQWAVFEPNGEALWANVRRTIEDFLLNEWQSGALLGDKPDKAYFVKCDRSTMTQNDLDNGRLICLIGVAPLRPAEFVIFRIGQWTGDRKA
jgi:uncharacterized protein